MPRRKQRDHKGDNFSADTRARVADARGSRSVVLETGEVPTPPSTPSQRALEALAALIAEGTGRFSCNASGNQTWYHKWRWSAGPLAGRYVMYVHDLSESPAEGVLGLVRKAAAAERGEVYATLDKYK